MNRHRAIDKLIWLLIGGFGYGLIEVLWRGYTHPSMLLLGGVSFLSLMIIPQRLARVPLLLRALVGCAVISILELITGILVNRILRLGVWDYSLRPFHLLGQICPLYSIYWLLLSISVLRILSHFPVTHSNTERRSPWQIDARRRANSKSR